MDAVDVDPEAPGDRERVVAIELALGSSGFLAASARCAAACSWKCSESGFTRRMIARIVETMIAEPRHAANRRLLRARDAMDRSYADALDIEALARSVHLSRAHFIRSFRDPFGNPLRITQPAEVVAPPPHTMA